MSDSISRTHTQELARLQRRFWTRFLWPVFLVFLAGYVLFILSLAILPFRPASINFSAVENQLIRSRNPVLHELVVTQRDYRAWLEAHGTIGEVRAFNNFSESIYLAALGRGGFSWLLGSFKFMFLRVSFLVLAAGRLWLFTSLLAILLARRRYQPYENTDDVLGQTGNGRSYFSGIQAGLRNLNSLGAPDFQVVGLACPALVGRDEVMSSSLGQFLEKTGAANETNVTLCAALLAANHIPAFAAPPSMTTVPPTGDASLADVSHLLLTRAHDLYNRYRSGAEGPAGILAHEKLPEPFSISSYMDIMHRAMHQSLPESFRKSIASLSPQMIFTTLLAYQAGKVLSYADEGGRWIQKSNYPQLSARAILHSIPSFAREYDFEQRKTIRRALIYASRSSVFGPVRFATDLSLESRALRQWVELLLEQPAKILYTTHDLELFALTYECHELWKQAFTVAVHELDSQFPDQIHITPGGLLLLPVTALMQVARKVIPAEYFKRLTELAQYVYTEQQKLALEAESMSDSIKSGVPEYEKIFAPLTKDERQTLAELHQLDERDLRQWSAFRIVLYTYGWLARRVGDYTVPESSVIFAVLHNPTSGIAQNELALAGQSSIVPLRGSRIAERLGRGWTDEFSSVSFANMAETQEHFNNLLHGITDDLQDDIQMAFR